MILHRWNSTIINYGHWTLAASQELSILSSVNITTLLRSLPHTSECHPYYLYAAAPSSSQRSSSTTCLQLLLFRPILFQLKQLFEDLYQTKPQRLKLCWLQSISNVISCKVFHAARPLMLSPKRERKVRDDRKRPSYHQPQHTDSTRLRQPMMQSNDIRGSAQNLMGMVQHHLLLLVVHNHQLTDTESIIGYCSMPFSMLQLKSLGLPTWIPRGDYQNQNVNV